MTKPNDGGPAFPVPGNPATMPGMTLRDWFAGQATEEDIRHWFDVFYANGISKTREECRYAYADAMLAAREAR